MEPCHGPCDCPKVKIFTPYIRRGDRLDWAYTHGMRAWRLLIRSCKVRRNNVGR